MPQPPSVAGSGASWAETKTRAALVRPATTSRTKSRLTIRLPDVTAPGELRRESTGSAGNVEQAVTLTTAPPRTASPKPTVLNTDVPSMSFGEASRRAISGLSPKITAFVCQPRFHPQKITAFVRQSKFWQHKVVVFVRQPKVWLSCIVAIAVQVVLAIIMTPAEDDAHLSQRPLSAAKAWTKPVAAPATRIVVPPAVAPSEFIEPADGARGSTTTPLGLALPLESSTDATGLNGQVMSDAESLDGALPATRVAENHRLADNGRQFDSRPVGHTDGATLGGIVPLEPSSEPNTNEPRQ
jgi:hypothetical protein